MSAAAIPDLTLIPGYDPYRDADGYRYDAELGERAVAFFPEFLTHIKGELAGQPFELAAWEASVVANLFGWVSIETGYRRYREALIYVPRKNGKTTLAAGIANYVFFTDGEPGAECYCAAGDKDQASILFDIAKEMVLADDDLLQQCKIYKAQRAIVIEGEAASLKPVSAESYSKHGYNIHFVVVDELHTQRDGELMDVLETSMGSRRQPLMICLTTADVKGESECNRKVQYARDVRDGLIDDPTFLPVIYEAIDGDDWESPELHARVNPDLGGSLKREYFARKLKKAQTQPHWLNTFKRLHLNIQTSATTGFVPLEQWDACPPVDIKVAAGARCFAGLDLASVSDMTAFVMFFPDNDNLVEAHFWVPEEHPEVKKSYRQWIADGYLKTTPGNRTDYEYVRTRIKLAGGCYDLDIGIDPYNSTHLCNQLTDQDGINCTLFRQGFLTMNEPTKELLRMILGGEIGHNGNPVLRWMINNSDVSTDAHENIKLDKKASKGKIDGAVALVMAIGRSMFGDVATSVYESRGLVTI